MLRDATGGWGSAQICITKVYGSTLLALRGGDVVSNFQKKPYLTPEWPLIYRNMRISD